MVDTGEDAVNDISDDNGDGIVDSQDSLLPTAVPASATSSPPSFLSDVPTRGDVDFLRNSWQYSPADINAFIDQKRPTLAAVGFTPQEIDDFYGVERFDPLTAAQEILTASKRVEDSDFPAETDSASQGTSTSPDYLLSASQSPDFFGKLMDMQSPPEARGLARQWLIHSYKIGAFNAPEGFRQSILESITDAGDAFDFGVNAWLGRMVSPSTFDVMSRRALVSKPIVDRIVRSSFIQKALGNYTDLGPGTAAALTSALFDHQMPTANAFIDTATISQFIGSGGNIKGMPLGADEDAAAPTETTAPDDWPLPQSQFFSEVGNTVQNLWNAYVGYNINPFQILYRGSQYPALFTALKSPDADIRPFFPEETKYGPFGDGADNVSGEQMAEDDTLSEDEEDEEEKKEEKPILKIQTGPHFARHRSLKYLENHPAGIAPFPEGEMRDGEAVILPEPVASTGAYVPKSPAQAETNGAAKEVIKAKAALVPEHVGPGPYAVEYVPAAPGRQSPAIRARNTANGYEYGCHRCGTKNPGTSSGHYYMDHQTPRALDPEEKDKIILPHCKACSDRQGGLVNAIVSKPKQSQ